MVLTTVTRCKGLEVEKVKTDNTVIVDGTEIKFGVKVIWMKKDLISSKRKFMKIN